MHLHCTSTPLTALRSCKRPTKSVGGDWGVATFYAAIGVRISSCLDSQGFPDFSLVPCCYKSYRLNVVCPNKGIYEEFPLPYSVPGNPQFVRVLRVVGGCAKQAFYFTHIQKIQFFKSWLKCYLQLSYEGGRNNFGPPDDIWVIQRGFCHSSPIFPPLFSASAMFREIRQCRL